VSCGFSKEILALHVGGDLPEAQLKRISGHLPICEDCRQFLEQLRTTQTLLKSLRSEKLSPSDCVPMRREVMSLINEGRDGSGWALRIERAIMLGFWRRSYSLAAFAVFMIISISGLAQMRQTTPTTWRSAAVFDRGNMLFRPEGYRNWTLVAPSSRHQSSDVGTGATSTPSYRVYINPLGYREYEKTGRFPDGTLLVWEAVTREPDTAPRPHQQSSLLVSVKDGSRFGGGWGFFDFTGLGGAVIPKAQVLPESSGCQRCHRREAETDHVFTQFYPVLQSARRARGATYG
jgi:Cytochrome P460